MTSREYKYHKRKKSPHFKNVVKNRIRCDGKLKDLQFFKEVFDLD